MEKFSGIFPAFYACYDDEGNVSPRRAALMTAYLRDKGVQGLYVGGSSGECIYLDKEERKATLEAVMEAADGMQIIAHVACNNTRDSMELAAHAQKLGVAAIAAIPPIYFHLPDHAVAQYWNDISSAAPDTDFIIYNIPQLAGVALNEKLLSVMLENPRVKGVKNSSMPTQDIQRWLALGGKDFTVFNGPDEQLVSGLVMGAQAGIGGTYAAMPELYLKLFRCVQKGDMEKARAIQFACNEIISALCATPANMYAVIKATLRMREGLSLGGVRAPLCNVTEKEMAHVEKCCYMINAAITRYV